MKRNYHHGNLREVLIREGLRLIAEKGVAGLTLREIGERAGVSRTAAYRHFADKAEILAAIREAGFLQFGDALLAARLSGTFTESFDAMGLAYVRFAEENRAYYEVMFGIGCDSGLEARGESAAGARAFGILEGMIRQGQELGEIRSGDPVMLAKFVWAFTHGLAMLRLETDYSRKGAGTAFVLAGVEAFRTGIQRTV